MIECLRESFNQSTYSKHKATPSFWILLSNS